LAGQHPSTPHPAWVTEALRAAGGISRQPSGRGFIALLEAFRASGGTAPGEIVGRLLEAHQMGDAVSLARLVRSGEVFGFEWRGNLWIPMFQFDANDLSVRRGPQRVRAALPESCQGWAQAAWFATPNTWLHEERPVDLLPLDLGAVIDAAARAPSLPSFPPPESKTP
jgi:hypothetical protein